MRWMRRSTAATALLLSFTVPPLTVWMRVRCFRVVEDCRGRSVREGWVVFELELKLELEPAAMGVLVVEEEDVGVKCVMYMFEAVDIALVGRAVARDSMAAGSFFWLTRGREEEEKTYLTKTAPFNIQLRSSTGIARTAHPTHPHPRRLRAARPRPDRPRGPSPQATDPRAL